LVSAVPNVTERLRLRIRNHARLVGDGVDLVRQRAGGVGRGDRDGLRLETLDVERTGGEGCGRGGRIDRVRAIVVVAVDRGAEVAGLRRDHLVRVRADLERGGAERTVQQLQTVEIGGVGNTVQFRDQLTHFRLQRLAVAGGVRRIGRLDGQFTNPLKDVARRLEGAFGRLRQGDPVVGVAAGLLDATDLGGEPLGNREASSIVLRGVDAQAGGQALEGRGKLILRRAQVTLRIQRCDVGADDLGHL
jgi:hypothetical protein